MTSLALGRRKADLVLETACRGAFRQHAEAASVGQVYDHLSDLGLGLIDRDERWQGATAVEGPCILRGHGTWRQPAAIPRGVFSRRARRLVSGAELASACLDNPSEA